MTGFINESVCAEGGGFPAYAAVFPRSTRPEVLRKRLSPQVTAAIPDVVVEKRTRKINEAVFFCLLGLDQTGRM